MGLQRDGHDWGTELNWIEYFLGSEDQLTLSVKQNEKKYLIPNREEPISHLTFFSCVSLD